MENADYVRTEEQTPVQLARMEGKIDLVMLNVKHAVDQLVTLGGRVTVLESEMKTQQSTSQTLTEGAEADKRERITLAAALKDAEEIRRTNTEQHWNPVNRVIAVIGGFGALVAIYVVFVPH